MNDIYIKTQKLMDEFLNSVSDQEFFDDYLALERFNGPLVKDFLKEYYFSESDYIIIGQSPDLELAIQEKMNASHTTYILPKIIQSCEYDSSYAANDENYLYGLAA
jgi:hypothetical protein